MHLHGLGIPIVGDPLYPVDLDVAIDDFRMPLQLLARELSFTDPIDGSARRFESVRQLPLAACGSHDRMPIEACPPGGAHSS